MPAVNWSECLLLLAAGLAGGLLPLFTRWKDRGLHLALALSTGVFLGAVFLHMLPALPGAGGHGAHGAAVDAELSPDLVWTFVLVGVLAIYLLQALVLRTHDFDELHRHRAIGYASLVGLSVHALTTGLALSAAATEASLEMPVFVAVVAHKAFESFSLCSVFQLANLPRARVFTLIVLFALITPAGSLLGTNIFRNLNEVGVGISLALAAGTFLYVCLAELLPEVFHHREDGLGKLGLLTLGVLVMAYIQEV